MRLPPSFLAILCLSVALQVAHAADTEIARGILGTWSTTTPDGRLFAVRFDESGDVEWKVGQSSLRGRFRTHDIGSHVEVDIFGLSHPHGKEGLVLGIARIDGDSMKFFATPTLNGRDIEGKPASRPTEFPEETLTLVRVKNKRAEPGATDNPDDAQRLREDH